MSCISCGRYRVLADICSAVDAGVEPRRVEPCAVGVPAAENLLGVRFELVAVDPAHALETLAVAS